MIPQENITIYSHIYCIESSLRELIINSLEDIDGPQWYKKRLPGDILQKYRQAKEYELSFKWTQVIPQHPIYYIDFPDLKKIIERKDNWEDIFKDIFLEKNVLISIFSEVEFIRNKIAHNRKSTVKDVEIVKTAYLKLSTAIGEEYFNELVSRCTCILDIIDRLKNLRKEAESSYCACKNYEPLEKPKTWESICNEWWFDESYLCHPITEIHDYFQTIKDYSILPITRGSGYKIELWVKSNDIDNKYKKAESELSSLLAYRR